MTGCLTAGVKSRSTSGAQDRMLTHPFYESDNHVIRYAEAPPNKVIQWRRIRSGAKYY
jgi:hypothetical protein